MWSQAQILLVDVLQLLDLSPDIKWLNWAQSEHLKWVKTLKLQWKDVSGCHDKCYLDSGGSKEQVGRESRILPINLL